MDKPKDGGPAFPVTPEYRFDETYGVSECQTFSGMSLRDYFAGQALTGLCVGRQELDSRFAEEAYQVADAMLRAREDQDE